MVSCSCMGKCDTKACSCKKAKRGRCSSAGARTRAGACACARTRTRARARTRAGARTGASAGTRAGARTRARAQHTQHTSAHPLRAKASAHRMSVLMAPWCLSRGYYSFLLFKAAFVKSAIALH